MDFSSFCGSKPANAKGGKQWRLVLDYRYLNSQTKDDPFPLSLIENLITKQSLNRIWSIFDLEDGFHQMHLHPDSQQELTAFVTPHGVYQWTVLPIGVKNGPAMFQRMIQWVLRELPFVMGNIDDVLVGTEPSQVYSNGNVCGDTPASSARSLRGADRAASRNVATGTSVAALSDLSVVDNAHLSYSSVHVMSNLWEVLRRHHRDVRAVSLALRRHKLFVKGSKMHLFRETIQFCGNILSKGQRREATSKLEAIRKWTPESITRITHLKGFLGLAQYYAIYMQDFAIVAVPLSRQLKNRTPDDVNVVWDE